LYRKLKSDRSRAVGLGSRLEGAAENDKVEMNILNSTVEQSASRTVAAGDPLSLCRHKQVFSLAQRPWENF